jgi:GTP diphosphokinase / guanosine-3',5'-bis(diphosphate) 3'-diphosphatase
VERWDKMLRDSSAKSRKEVLGDIGLGKRLPAIVARRLLALYDHPAAEGANGVKGAKGAKAAKGVHSITIRGTEGMAVQFASCCNPIPGDPIIGFIKKGEGLVIHTHDCKTAIRSRSDPEKWIDVDWDPETDKLFDVNVRTTVLDKRGVLAKIAAAIAEAGCNIANISVEESSDMYATNHFTLQVSSRQHLARVMRALRSIPEVVRIARVKD